MISGENVYVRGFGSFVVKKRAEKTARNISKKHSYNYPGALCTKLQTSKSFC